MSSSISLLRASRKTGQGRGIGCRRAYRGPDRIGTGALARADQPAERPSAQDSKVRTAPRPARTGSGYRGTAAVCEARRPPEGPAPAGLFHVRTEQMRSRTPWLPICDTPQKFPAQCARCVRLRITGTICPKTSPSNGVTCIMLPNSVGLGADAGPGGKGGSRSLSSVAARSGAESSAGQARAEGGGGFLRVGQKR